ncbi:MAG TPA: type II toxin-antitoxin system prevent-host-death family antitoxin [Chloroflexota bacterium]|jgi:prevent-host-death family protein|nr:type II toxin-antitoxin system prevent-host-death family antitoxin [Chloroflexota bacterium]
MKTVGSYEAKTHLPRLLKEVAQGRSILITNHGVPVAKLVPPVGVTRRDVGELVEEARRMRARAKPLGDITVKQLIEEGRRTWGS